MARKKRGRGRTDYRRRRRTGRSERPRLLIVCEGSETEPIYFHRLRTARQLATAHIEVAPSGGEPKALLVKAERLERAAREEGNPFDFVWCVMDVDTHPQLPGILDKISSRSAARRGRAAYHAAVSDPCFELWYLLHFQYSTGSMTPRQVLNRLKKHIPGYEKSADVWDTLEPLQAEAMQNAVKLREHHAATGGGGNPSTAVDLLVTVLNNL